MGIFYNDPQPVQRTPRLPASAFTTGSQPPRTAVAASIAMACVLASWPAQGEPPLHQQNRNPRQIAPLTLVYGQQPPINGAITPTELAQIRSSWPEQNEPRLQFNNQQPERRYIVAQTFKYGSQPIPAGPLTPTETNKIVRWWDQPFQFPQNLPSAAVLYVPPVVNNPIPSAGQFHIVRSAWEPPFQYPESGPTSASWNLPVAQSYLAPNEFPWWIQAAWRIPDPDIQFAGNFTPDTAADQPPVTGAITPTELSLVRVAWEPPRPEPPALVKIAALTLPSGRQPPITGALSVTQQLIIATPPPTWYAQSENDNASWNIPAVNNPPPFTPQLHVVRLQWEPPFFYAESESNNAAWNVPVVSAFIPSSRHRAQILEVWNVYPPPQQRLRTIASLLAPVVVVQTDALTGIILTNATLDGLIEVAPALDGFITIGPQLRGIIIIRPA